MFRTHSRISGRLLLFSSSSSSSSSSTASTAAAAASASSTSTSTGQQESKQDTTSSNNNNNNNNNSNDDSSSPGARAASRRSQRPTALPYSSHNPFRGTADRKVTAASIGSPGHASGSRPRANDKSEPFTLKSPLPTPKFTVERKHLLLVHDTLTKIDPAIEVKAYILDKAEFAYDVQCLLPPEALCLDLEGMRKNFASEEENRVANWFFQRTSMKGTVQTKEEIQKIKEENVESRLRIRQLARELQVSLQNVASLVDQGEFKSTIEFHDKAKLTIGFGVKGIVQDDLNCTPDAAKRDLMRASCNFDAEAWDKGWTIWFREVVDSLDDWGEVYRQAGHDIPRHYWAAHAFWGRKRIFEEGQELFKFVKENFPMTLHLPLPHPVLRGENMNSLRSVREMAQYAKSDRMAIFGDAEETPFTKEEIKELERVNNEAEKEYFQRKKMEAKERAEFEKRKSAGQLSLFEKWFDG